MNPDPVATYPGRCHCGDVAYSWRTAIAPRDWPIRACQCTFCRRHGALSVSDPDGSLEFRIARPETLIRYRFGLRITDFLICGNCGIYVAACMDSPRGKIAVISVNTLDPVPEGLPAPKPMNYDGESTGDRETRREQRWTPVIDTL